MPDTHPEIRTQRLRLVAMTRELACLQTDDRAAFFKALGRASKESELFYPQLLAITVGINVPSYLNLIWPIAKRLMPAKTLSKFRPARAANQESAADAARRAEAQRAAVRRGSLGVATHPAATAPALAAFPTPPDAQTSPRGGGRPRRRGGASGRNRCPGASRCRYSGSPDRAATRPCRPCGCRRGGRPPAPAPWRSH